MHLAFDGKFWRLRLNECKRGAHFLGGGGIGTPEA